MVLKGVDIVWLIDESARRHENRMLRVTEVFAGADVAITSATSHKLRQAMTFSESLQ